MTELLRTLSLFAITVFFSLLLKEAGFKGAKLVSLLGMCAILMVAIGRIGELIKGLNLGAFGASVEEAGEGMIKILGVGYVFGVSSDVCREIGENGVSSCMLMVGRVEILLLALPFLKEALALGNVLL